jgi:hypothetical protein
MRRVYGIRRANRVRDALTTDLGRRIIANVLHGEADPRRLLGAVRRAAGAGRLLVYSAHPDEQRRLTGTDVSGDGPTAPGTVSVVVDNGGGNKLDAYLARAVDYTTCTGTEGTARLTVRLTNQAPRTGLPGPVVGLRVRDAQDALLPAGTNRSLLYVFGPSGARLRTATLDGRPATIRFGRERGHPVYATVLDLQPGQTRTLVLRLTTVSDALRPRIDVQPAALEQRSVIDRENCSVHSDQGRGLR